MLPIHGHRPVIRSQPYGTLLMATLKNGLTDSVANLSPPKRAGLNADEILTAMLNVSSKISTLIFSPGRTPQVGWNGSLTPALSLPVFSADDTRRLALDLMGANEQPRQLLQNEGSADFSYSLSGASRFRVNVFCQ